MMINRDNFLKNLKNVIFFVTSFLAIIIFIGIYLIDSNIISIIIKQSNKEIFEILNRQKIEKIESIKTNITLISDIISKNISTPLYDMEKDMIFVALSPFMSIKEIEAIEIFDNASNQTFAFLWKEKGISYSTNIPLYLNLNNIDYILTQIVHNNNIIGNLKIYYRLEPIIGELQKNQNAYLESINEFEKRIKQLSIQLNISEVIAIFILLFIVNMLTYKLINRLSLESFKYQQKLKEKNTELKEKNLILIEKSSEIEKKENELQTVLNNVNEGIVILDEDSNIVYINPFFEKLLKTNRHHLIGLNFLKLLSENDSEKLLYISDNVYNNTRLKFIINNFKNEQISVETSISQLEQQNRVILVIKDRTDDMKYIQNLEQLATTDHLTKISNRYRCNSKIDEAINNKINFSIIMIDIDHFKSINDTYGHDMGDKVLVEISYQINSILRHSICFARWGGEEFLIILKTDIQLAYKIAEDIRDKISKLRIEPIKKITISLGVSEYNNVTKTEFLKRIDDALYEAKKSGRNKTIKV